MASKITVNAAEVIAKLHFAGLMSKRKDIEKENGFAVNTGIVNDNPDGDPEHIGKTRFKLGADSYQFGIVRDFTYHQSFGLLNSLNEISKLRAELYNADAELLSHFAKNEAEAAKMQERFAALAQHIYKELTDASKKPSVDDKTFIDLCKKPDELKKIRDEVNKAIDDNVGGAFSDYNDVIKTAKTEVAGIISEYMNVFAGADNVKKIDAKTLSVVQVSNSIKDSNDKNLVKDFQIQEITKGERAKLMNGYAVKSLTAKDKEKDDSGRMLCTLRMCFYVEYKLSVE